LIDIASDSARLGAQVLGHAPRTSSPSRSRSRARIVDASCTSLTQPRESQRLVALPLDDIRAYESYLKAKQEMHDVHERWSRPRARVPAE
jgi:hypothetical protein